MEDQKIVQMYWERKEQAIQRNGVKSCSPLWRVCYFYSW